MTDYDREREAQAIYDSLQFGDTFMDAIRSALARAEAHGLGTKVIAVTARCAACGAYCDNIEWHAGDDEGRVLLKQSPNPSGSDDD